MATISPDTYSAAMMEMQGEWQQISHILAGAMKIREQGDLYLPKFPDEESTDFNERIKVAPWTPLYKDSTRGIVGKPFSRPLTLTGTIVPDIATWFENIDNAGHDLHSWAKAQFEKVVHYGVGFILVDHTETGAASSGRAVSQADEKASGARPYFRWIPILDCFAAYLEVRNGRTVFRQIRFRDNKTVILGMEETTVERVRQFDDIEGVLSVTTYTKGTDGKWAEETKPIVGAALTQLPIVPVLFGDEVGQGPFVLQPTMGDLGHKQIEHYRQSNRVDNIMDHACFPMLQGKGLLPPMEETEDELGNKVMTPKRPRIGSRAVLWAPPSMEGQMPEFGWIEPSGQSIAQARDHRKDIENEIRTLGLQPLLPSQGINNMAATTSVINAARAHSAIMGWTLIFKDALEQALVFMAQWRGLPETTEVDINTDFAAEVLQDKDETILTDAKASNLITWDTWVEEMQRRQVLGPQFDKARERAVLEAGTDPLSIAIGPGIDPEDDPFKPESPPKPGEDTVEGGGS